MDLIPQGLSRIAQRFNVGFGGGMEGVSPEGGCYEIQKLPVGFYGEKLMSPNFPTKTDPGTETRESLFCRAVGPNAILENLTFLKGSDFNVFYADLPADKALTNHFVTPSEGTTEDSESQSSLRDLTPTTSQPNDESLGYFRWSLRDNAQADLPGPFGISPPHARSDLRKP